MAMENEPVEDVFHIKNGDFPASYVSLPESGIFRFHHYLSHVTFLRCVTQPWEEQKGNPTKPPSLERVERKATNREIHGNLPAVY